MLETRLIRVGATGTTLKGEGCVEGDVMRLSTIVEEEEDDDKVVERVSV